MSEKYSIKDLPDTSTLIDAKSYLVSGQQLKVQYELLKQLWRGENINKGPNIRLRQMGDGGISLSVPNMGGGTTSAAKNTPFQIFATKHIVEGVWDNTYDITLWPGTANGAVPDNIFDTVNQGITSTQYVVLTLNSDGYGITSSSWDIESTQPTQPEAVADMPPSTFYVIIGVIFYNATPNTISVYQIVYNNIVALPTVWITVPRPAPGPFGMATMNYYCWKVSS